MTTMDTGDPLEELLVDAMDLDRKAITEALKGKLAIDSKSGKLHHADGFSTLKTHEKILSIIVAQKAARLLDRAENEAITFSRLVEVSGLPSGTVAPRVRALKKQHLISQDDSKAYYVADAQVAAVLKELRP